jgi:hypothetical protein
MREVNKLFQFNIPNFDSTLVNVIFNTRINNKLFIFKLLYRNTKWICWVIMPDNTIRYFGLIPNVLNWKDYSDYGIILYTNDIEITQSNIQGQSIGVIEWLT